MSHFSFSCYNSGRNTTVEFECEHIDEVIENFEEFLRGCGYYFSGQITRYDPEPKAAQQIRVDEVVGQPFATDSVGLGPEAYTGGPSDLNIHYEGHDW